MSDGTSVEADSKVVKPGLWDWVGALCLASLTILILVKIAQIPVKGVDIEFRFTDLLALILSIFAIGLSVAFYMRSTKDSNNFYLNTYSFTRDVSQALGRIEAVFGERLAHLDRSYESIRQAVFQEGSGDETDAAPGGDEAPPAASTDAQNELEDQLAERDSMIERLTQRAAESDEERAALRDELGRQIERVEELLRRQQQDAEETALRSREAASLRRAIVRYLRESVIPRVGIELVVEAPADYVRERFREVLAQEPASLIDDMRRANMLDDQLRLSGNALITIRRIARGMIENY